MRARLFLVAAGLVLLATAAAIAADVTGKWTAQVPGRGGQTRETTFNLKVDGDKLTGSMTGFQGNDIQITDGKVGGDDISFTTKLSFGGNDVTILYKGKVAGDEIKFTRQREGADQTTEFTAKRAK